VRARNSGSLSSEIPEARQAYREQSLATGPALSQALSLSRRKTLSRFCPSVSLSRHCRFCIKAPCFFTEPRSAPPFPQTVPAGPFRLRSRARARVIADSSRERRGDLNLSPCDPSNKLTLTFVAGNTLAQGVAVLP